MIVPDSSALVEVLLRTRDGQSIADRLFGGNETLHVPHLLDIEVVHVLRRYAALAELSSDHARVAIELLARFPVTRYSHDALLPRMWELRRNLTAYDAAYVALAELIQATFVTRDAKLASVARRHIDVELV